MNEYLIASWRLRAFAFILSRVPERRSTHHEIDKITVEVAEIAQGLARKIVESCLDHGDPISPALSKRVASNAVDLLVPVSVRQ